MNYSRIALAAVGAMVAYFAFGGLTFGLVPQLREEFRKYPNVYRDHDGIMAVMPIGMVAMFLSILALAVIYALAYRAGWGAMEGLRFGALIGLFAVGSFVIHNYVNLNIGAVLAAEQAIAYFIEWTLVGLMFGLIYKPAVGP